MAIITILATLTVRPEDATELETTLANMARLQGETEPGTIRFDYYTDAGQEGVYWLVEDYATREALDFHISNPATKEQRAALRRLITGPADVRFLTLLGSL